MRSKVRDPSDLSYVRNDSDSVILVIESFFCQVFDIVLVVSNFLNNFVLLRLKLVNFTATLTQGENSLSRRLNAVGVFSFRDIVILELHDSAAVTYFWQQLMLLHFPDLLLLSYYRFASNVRVEEPL